MSIQPSVLFRQLSRLDIKAVISLVSLYGDRPYTRRAASMGSLKIEGVRPIKEWWLLQVCVEVHPGIYRWVGLTRARGTGKWICRQIKAIPEPGSEPVERRPEPEDAPLDREYVAEV